MDLDANRVREIEAKLEALRLNEKSRPPTEIEMLRKKNADLAESLAHWEAEAKDYRRTIRHLLQVIDDEVNDDVRGLYIANARMQLVDIIGTEGPMLEF